MAGTIGISAVIDDIKSRPGQYFSIDYCVGTGKDRGDIRRMMRCIYGVPKESDPWVTRKVADKIRRRKKSHQSDPNTDFQRMYVDRGLLPITDLDTGRFVTLKISHLVRYDLKRILH